jgi:hypothetical protein
LKKIILMLIAIITITCGCNKTKQTINKIFGTYEINEYTVDGMDSLSLFRDSLSNTFYFYYDDGSLCYEMTIEGHNNWGNYRIVSCSWRLINKKTIQVYRTNGHIGTGPFGVYRTPEFEILNLTKNELKIKTVYNNKEYNVLLKK